MSGVIRRRALMGNDNITFIESIDSSTDITFNTKVSLTKTHSWEVDSVPCKTNAWQTWLSCWDGSSSLDSNNAIVIQTNSNNDSYVLFFGNPRVIKLLNVSGKRCKVSDSNGTLTAETSTFTHPLYDYNPNFPLRVTSKHIYSVKIWNNGTLVNEFLPAKVGNNVGMYDTVTKTFRVLNVTI